MSFCVPYASRQQPTDSLDYSFVSAGCFRLLFFCRHSSVVLRPAFAKHTEGAPPHLLTHCQLASLQPQSRTCRTACTAHHDKASGRPAVRWRRAVPHHLPFHITPPQTHTTHCIAIMRRTTTLGVAARPPLAAPHAAAAPPARHTSSTCTHTHMHTHTCTSLRSAPTPHVPSIRKHPTSPPPPLQLLPAPASSCCPYHPPPPPPS